jgi:hypothetical protein
LLLIAAFSFSHGDGWRDCAAHDDLHRRHSTFYLVFDAFHLVHCAFGYPRTPPTTSPDEFVGFHVSMDVGGRPLETGRGSTAKYPRNDTSNTWRPIEFPQYVSAARRPFHRPENRRLSACLYRVRNTAENLHRRSTV